MTPKNKVWEDSVEKHEIQKQNSFQMLPGQEQSLLNIFEENIIFFLKKIWILDLLVCFKYM